MTKLPPQLINDLTGCKFGRWTVVRYLGRQGSSKWLCRCDCGSERAVAGAELRRGNSKSCGCYRDEQMSIRATTHGLHKTPEYRAWRGMIGRCRYQSHPRYSRYGARGITVCDRWQHDFLAFLADVGHRPTPNHSIDRINNDGHYSPDNVRWATKRVQSNNRHNTKYVPISGANVPLTFAAEETGISAKVLHQRLERNLSGDQLLKKPRNTKPLHLDAFGERKTLREWAEIYGLRPATLWNRLSVMKLPVEEALTRRFNQKSKAPS